MKTVCLFGYFGMKNLGDEALMQSLKENYTKPNDNVYVINNANILYKFPLLLLTDEVLSSGGWVNNSFQTKLWLTILKLMKFLNPSLKIRFIGVSMDGCGLPNLMHDVADELKIRDFNTEDIAFKARLNSKKKKIGIDIVPTSFKGQEWRVKELIRTAEKEGFEVYLLPFSTMKRTPLTGKRVESDEDFFEKLGYKNKIVREYTVNGMKYVISKMDFMICCHYHSHVFTLMEKVPFLSIPYSQKVRDLAKRMKFEDKMVKFK